MKTRQKLCFYPYLNILIMKQKINSMIKQFKEVRYKCLAKNIIMINYYKKKETIDCHRSTLVQTIPEIGSEHRDTTN